MSPRAIRPPLTLAALAMTSVFGAQAAAQPSPSAAASPAADPNAETARRYFEAGVAAMQREDWAEAVNGFENSLRLRRAASVSLNLGIARHRLGRLVEARVALADFLAAATPAQHAQHDAEVGRLVAEIGRRAGRIRLAELRPTASTVTIDGQPALFNDAGEVAVNPGSHRLRAEAEGFVPREETVVLTEGATPAVRLVLVPVAAVAGVGRGAAEAPSRSIVTRWWFWTGVGVLVAGATAGIVVAASSTTTTVTVPPSSTGRVLQGVSGGAVSW